MGLAEVMGGDCAGGALLMTEATLLGSGCEIILIISSGGSALNAVSEEELLEGIRSRRLCLNPATDSYLNGII